ncbi:MAG: methyltransferase domain-containing protein [Treponema sp.]|jgi:2-polyprenyl-3-methyl-5-hydroxy-6-metoxy-1,4-benzoquinol methylase/spore coat polysaccharide biosynthesis predicted glycosyltransferase SpsG|nr:methyltransferase domain-containing protein [Treponema sp.]
MMQGPLLVVSTFEKGRGGGHLVRSLVLIRTLRSLKQEAYLYIPELEPQDVLVHSSLVMTQEAKIEAAWFMGDIETIRKRRWACIILDRFRTASEEFAQWAALAPLIGIDEGGPQRDSFDFLIDLLPGPPGRVPPNILAPSLLPLPKNQRPSFYAPQRQTLKILVSFGAEDPGALTLPACLALKVPGQTEITALFGGFHQTTVKEQYRAVLAAAGIQVVEGMVELRDQLACYDLVVTHFGLTAFESLAARVPVLLLSPGAYHEKLAVHTGFISGGIGEKGAHRLRRILYTQAVLDTQHPKNRKSLILHDEALKSLGDRCEQLRVRYGLNPPEDEATSPQGLGDLVERYTLRVPAACPVCGGTIPTKDPVCARFPDRTYRRCRRCGMVYLLRSTLPPIEYERDYFFSFYKQQYGKTYLEDFPNLVQYGKKRLRYSKQILCRSRRNRGEDPSKTQARLLDIGCAYGPFLVAAREEGFLPFGMDPAEDAVRYVQDELHIPAFRGFFPETPVPEEVRAAGFDLISLWYVLEHFEKPGAVLTALYQLLKPGGVLAFSTPSGSGISSRKSFPGFLEQSPPDHWTLWQPSLTGSILKRFGFRIKKVVISGHHPERFPLVGRFLGEAGKKNGMVYGLFLWISRIFHLGDTFEVYAIKKPAVKEGAVVKSAGGE